MFIRNILKAFCEETKVKLTINGHLIEDIATVKDYMASGLLTYTTTEQATLKISKNAIIIKLK